jgi:hypothetical protein
LTLKLQQSESQNWREFKLELDDRPLSFPALGFIMSQLAFRDMSEAITSVEIDGAKTLDFSFASETPHRRMDWENWEIIEEILVCSQESIKGTRLQDGLIQFLWNHNPDAVRGVISNIDWKPGKGYATARLSKKAASEELYQDAKDGIIKGISVGYQVHKYEEISPALWEGDRWDSKLIRPKQVRAVEWEIFEISAVSIPADATVGIGRNDRPVPESLPQLITAIGIEKVKKALNQMSDQKQDIRSTTEYRELDDKYRDSQAQLTSTKADNEALRGQVAALQADLSKVRSEAEIGKKYANLKSQADALVRETKLTGQEYDDLFCKNTEELCKDPDALVELRAIEKLLGIAGKRSAMLNTKASKVPAELPDDVNKKKAAEPEKSDAALGYENAWRK